MLALRSRIRISTVSPAALRRNTHTPSVSPKLVHKRTYSSRTGHSPIFMGDNIVNFYAGQPPLNRLSFQRGQVDQINQHLQAKDAQFILFRDHKPLMKKNEPGHIFFQGRDQVEALLGQGYVIPSAADLENKDRAKILESARPDPDAPALVFLGIDDRPSASPNAVPASSDPLNPEGRPYFALNISDPDWSVDGGEFGDARSSSTAMDGWSAGIFAQARALIDWNVRNRFCPACGSRTYSLWAGWKRNCVTALEPTPGKACFSLQGLHNFAYPRTDPVIIMGIINDAGDKILLGRQAKWPKGMYSCLAGFIEPGESFEDAVRREVLEEAGIEVGPVRYSSSQPWPYPANLMVGCFGRASDDQKIRLDLDNELEDAQWFDRSEISNLVGSPSGSKYSPADIKRLDELSNTHSHLKTSTSDQETANALAPSERKEGEANVGSGVGLTRVPPDSAIAGQLIRLWAKGGLDLVSRL